MQGLAKQLRRLATALDGRKRLVELTVKEDADGVHFELRSVADRVFTREYGQRAFLIERAMVEMWESDVRLKMARGSVRASKVTSSWT